MVCNRSCFMKRIWFLIAGVVLVLGIGAGLVFGLGGGKPKTYTVEITSNVEQIEYESKNNCRLGDNITIEAIPLDGYRFIGWEVNGVIVSEDVEYEITLTQENVNNVYRAMYKQIFNIYTGEVQNGNVASNVTKAIEGETIILTITPNDHYAFESAYYIQEDSTEQIAITNSSFTMPAGDVIIYATFTSEVPDEGMFETLLFMYDNAYKTASVRANSNNKPAGELVIPEKVLYNGAVYDVTSIYSANSFSDGAFYNCSDLISVTIPNSVTSIGDSAFYGCSSLTSVTIPNGVTSIGDYAFEYCSSLTSITIPNSVTSIGGNAFYGCYALAEVYNKSHLSITKGSSDYGRVAEYAEAVYSGDEINTPTKIEKIDGVAYYKKRDTSYIALVCIDKIKTTISLDSRTTEIRQYAFSNCGSLTNVTIPNSITSIGNYAFQSCRCLTSVTIPNSVTSIGSNAFINCHALAEVYNKSSLNIKKGSSDYGYVAYYAEVVYSGDTIDTPSKIEEIDGVAYYKKSDTSYIALVCIDKTKTTISLDSRTTEIRQYAFSNCGSLTSVTIPNSVTSMGKGAFYNCSSLTSVTIPNSVTGIGEMAFYNCSSLTSVNIPDSVTSMGDWAFSGCSSLTSVTIPNSVTYISSSAFCDCSSLTNVTIPNSVTSMGERAFYGCSSLTSVNIPSGVTGIGHYAFYGCSSLTSVTIPNSVTGIGVSAFSGCSSLTSVTIPNGVTSIGDSAFSDCSSLTSVNIPNSVTSIKSNAFYHCYALAEVYNKSYLSITKGSSDYGYVAYYALNVYDLNNFTSTSKIELIDGVEYYKESDTSYIALKCIDKTKTTISLDSRTTKINDYAFSGCSSLTSVTIPNSVTSIGVSAFYGCSSLTSVTIPNSVTNIGSSAFSNCSSLASVTIGSGVTSIGDYAFWGCSKLYIVNNLSQLNITAGNSNYGYVANYAHLVVSDENFVDKLEEIDGVMYYKESSTNYKAVYFVDTTITSVTLNENTTEICYKAFYNCSSLTSMSIPNSVTSIGNEAFSGCSSLTSVTIPNSVTGIGSYAFSGCSSLTSVIIGNTVTSIGEWAFSGCSSLTSITIPDSVTSIGDYAFYYCSSLTSITIPNSVTSIGYNAFYYCYVLAEVHNKSSLSITKGLSDYGYVAYYAEVVYSGDTIDTPSKIEEIDGVKYYKESDTSYIALKCTDKTKTTISLDSRTTRIKENAFSGCRRLTSVEIGSGVTSIGNEAFSGCSSLTKVTIESLEAWLNISFIGGYSNPLDYAHHLYIGNNEVTELTIPEGITEIKNYAFRNCSSLTSIIIPNSVTSIGQYVFYNCSSLTSVTIPDGVTSIGDQAFNYCSSLTSVTIPNSVTNIGNSAFSGCSKLYIVNNLSQLNITAGNSNYGYVAYYAHLVVSDENLADKLEEIDGVMYYKESSTNYKAVYVVDTTITSVTLNENTTEICRNAFYNCRSLTSVTIPNSVTSIGTSAFYGCTGLTSITIPNNVTSIGNSAFSGCSKLYIVNNLSQLNITAGNSNYGYVANYAYLVVSDENFTNKIEELDGVMYYKESPTNYKAVYVVDTTITSVTLNENTTEICYKAFSSCRSLTSVTIPNSVTSIGSYAFFKCSSLASVTIGSGVTSIGSNAFNNCGNLYIINNLSQLNIRAENSDYGYVAYNANLVVSDENFADKLEEIDGVMYYKESSTNYKAVYAIDKTITSVTLNENTTEICRNAFQYCSSLTSVTIPNGVTSIGSSAFYYCGSLASVTIPNSVTSIGDYAFYYCSSLTSVTIPNGVTSIGSHAFYDCSSLTSVTIPNSVTSIGDHAFYDCRSLTSVTIPNSVTSIGDYAFIGCSSLTSVTIPNSVTSIGERAFYNCRSLTSVTIGSGVTSIGSDAFYGCYALAEVYNLSSLNITKGSEDYGYVGKYAEYIQTDASAASRIRILDGVAYYVNGSEFVAIGLIDKTITTLTFNSKTTKIRGNSFRDCDNLRYVIVSNKVTKITDNAFCNCTGLISIYIPNSVTTISAKDNKYENAPFYGCDENLHIHVEATSAPSGWKSKWNYYDSSNQYDTNWGYSLDLYKALIDYEG